MLRIRLRRVGSKKQPSFRIVIAESSSPRDGKFVEKIGFYNPRTEPETVRVDEGRALYWLSVGASPSESVQRIFTTIGTMARFERMRAGEPIEALVEEARAAKAAEAAELAEEAAPEEPEAAPEEPEAEAPEAEETEEAAPEEPEAEAPEAEEAAPEEPEAAPEEPEAEAPEPDTSEPETSDEPEDAASEGEPEEEPQEDA